MKWFVSILCLAAVAMMLLPARLSADELLQPSSQSSAAIRGERGLVRLPLRDEPNDSLVLTEDFENGADNWSTRDLTNLDTAWHRSDFLQREDDNLHWWCGDTITEYENDYIGYRNIWRQYLDTPVLNLSEAGDNLRLTFDAYWLIEDPRRVPPPEPWDGWDGWFVQISEDGGENFETIEPISPGYTAERISAAERFWGMDPTPGWVFESGEWDAQNDTTPEPDWVECSFNLSAYRSEDVVIRFVLVTDRAVAAPFNYYLRNSGVILDNILIRDGNGEVFLSNNADDDPVPADLIPRRGGGFGDHWELTDADAHSGEWSMHNDDDFFNVNNSLDSPPFEVPEDMNCWFQFWVYCDLPDAVHQGDNLLKDFYQIYISIDEGETWTYLTHDYNRPEAGGEGWTHYVPGVPFAGNLDLSLNDYAGETAQLRWLFITDTDHREGNGAGLFLDDIEVRGGNRANRDGAAENLYVPYPTTVGYRMHGTTVDLRNYGLQDLTSVWAYWGAWSAEHANQWPILPRPSIDIDDFVRINLTDYADVRDPGWTPIMPGVFTVWARTAVGSGTPADQGDDDEIPDNDSTALDGVRIWPAGVFELGHDNRTIHFAYPFDAGTGPAARFSPDEHGINGYSIAGVHFIFNGQQQGDANANLVIMRAGQDENTPGDGILNIEITVPPDSCLPNSMTVMLTEYEEVRDLEGEFWVWLRLSRDDNRPQIVGDDLLRGQGRFFTYDNQNATPFDADLAIHPLIVIGAPIAPNLAAMLQSVDFGEAYVGQPVVRTFTLYSVGLSDVTIRNVTANDEAFEVLWPGEVTLGFGKSVSFEIIFTPAAAEIYIAQLEIESDDENPPPVDLVGSGALAAPEQPLPPESFNLNAAWPNPFNADLNLSFTLGAGADVKLSIYDIAGREAMSFNQNRFEAGSHIVSLNAEKLPVGVYWLKLTAGSREAVRKVVLLK